MPRFVLQHHIFASGDEHWDLMFEVGAVLRTWSLASPLDDPSQLPTCAQQLDDHRIDYLEYEGEVSGDRGRVEIHDRGAYEWSSEVEAPLETVDELAFQLDGQRTSGHFRLQRIPHEGKDLWGLQRMD